MGLCAEHSHRCTLFYTAIASKNSMLIFGVSLCLFSVSKDGKET